MEYFLLDMKLKLNHSLLIQGLNQRLKNKVPNIGTASLNLADFASKAEGKEFELSIPLTVSGTAAEPHPSLTVSIL